MICPNCEQEIHYLHYEREMREWGSWDYEREMREWGSWDSEGIYNGDEDETLSVRFSCPECYEKITGSSEIAYDLMNGEYFCPVCGERKVRIDGEICQECRAKKELDEKPF